MEREHIERPTWYDEAGAWRDALQDFTADTDEDVDGE